MVEKMNSDPSDFYHDQNIRVIRIILEESLNALDRQDLASADLTDEANKIFSDPKLFGPFLKRAIQTRNPINGVTVDAGFARDVVKFVYNLVLEREPDNMSMDAFSVAISRGEMNFDSFSREVALSEEARKKKIEKTKKIYNDVFDQIQKEIWDGRAILQPGAGLTQETPPLPTATSGDASDSLGRLKVDQAELRDLIGIIYRACLGRTPSDEEVGVWTGHVVARSISVVEFCRMIAQSEEATNYSGRLNHIAPELTDAQFTQMAYEALLERGAAAPEIASWAQQISSGQTNRMQMLGWLFTEYVLDHTVRPIPENNPYEVYLMGTDKKINAFDWKKDLETLKLDRKPDGDQNKISATKRPESQFTFNIKKKSTIVTAIASLYKGGAYIQDFLKNMTDQSIFKDYAELIIIDANSPENESVIIEKFSKDFPNIKYKRYDYRVGIYDAWNIGIKASEGQFLTNTNMDDVRRHDSLERQAAALLELPFVDVVYQDFYYAFDKNVPYDDIAYLGAKSKVGMVTPHTMFTSNPPHNAPMWRKSLHDELGLFDGSYKSAGDYEFWMRCLTAGKLFYKLNDPHATYFQNPHGLSTSRETPGIVESKRITKKYGRKVIPDILTCSTQDFLKSVGVDGNDPGVINPSERYDYIQAMLEKAAFDLKYKAVSEQES